MKLTPLDLYQGNMNIILNVDITLFIFACLLLFVSFKLPKNREEAKLFWNKKTTKAQL